MKRWAILALTLLVLAAIAIAVRKAPPAVPAAPRQDPPMQTPHADAKAYTPAEANDDAMREVAVVELDALRDELPDNLYWRDGAPTDDPAVLERREADKARRNTLYGKILSGGATDAEIEQYFAYRERLSRDYIILSQNVLGRYGDTLSDQERGLYELSINMHGMRLQELPRAKSDAYARKARQESARAAWNAR